MLCLQNYIDAVQDLCLELIYGNLMLFILFIK
jgi:hypothetical protein